MAKARPEIQRITVPGALKKKRVSRRKDKSTGSYFAERIRKLRTLKKGGGGLNSSKTRKFYTVLKKL